MLGLIAVEQLAFEHLFEYSVNVNGMTYSAKLVALNVHFDADCIDHF